MPLLDEGAQVRGVIRSRPTGAKPSDRSQSPPAAVGRVVTTARVSG
ncbi:hypothetical protein SAZ11_15115 [Streptomyces sp. FXJ1.4098]|nr:hypothetical protein [Streptomyces sp. FXJ1.4098]